MREHGLGAPGVAEARVALDRAVEDEPVDEAGHAAPAEQDAIGELVHPEPSAGRLGELEEGVVLGEREVVLGAEVLVEQPLETGVGEQEPAPGRDRGDRARTGVRRVDSVGRRGESGSHRSP